MEMNTTSRSSPCKSNDLNLVRKTVTAALFMLGVSVCAQPDELKSSTSLAQVLEHTTIYDWDESEETDGVTISYRDIEFSNGDKTRQLKAEFSLYASFDTILKYIKKPDLVSNWNEGFRLCKLTEDHGDQWILYCEYDIPFPLSKKDLIADYRLKKNEHHSTVNTYARPDYKPEVKGFEREHYNFSEWTITRVEHEHYKVKFNVITLSNSGVPNFVKDPIIQRTLIESFVQLRLAVSGG